MLLRRQSAGTLVLFSIYPNGQIHGMSSFNGSLSPNAPVGTENAAQGRRSRYTSVCSVKSWQYRCAYLFIQVVGRGRKNTTSPHPPFSLRRWIRTWQGKNEV